MTAHRALALGAGVYQQQPIARMVELAQRMEELGYDHIGFNDNQCGSREAMLTLGAAAVSTSRIRIGTAVANPVTRHLSVLAGAFYSLQELAGDRVFMGLGRGELSVSLIGAERTKVNDLGWVIESLRKLWAGEAVEIDGHATTLSYARESRAVPVYVAASAPRMLTLAGRLADGVMISAGAHAPYIQTAAEHARNGAAAAGRDPKTVRVIARMACVVSDDPAEWRAAATHVAMSIVRRSASILDEEDYEAAGRIRESYSSAGHLELETEYTEHVTERLLRKMALVGTAAEVRERVERLAALGVDQLDIIPAGLEPVRVLETFARAMGL